MNKKIFMWMLVMIMLITTASASLTNGLGYFSFDSDDVSGVTLIDSMGQNNASCMNMGGDCNTVVGKLINASSFTSGVDYIDCDASDLTNLESVNYWYEEDGDQTSQSFYAYNDGNNYVSVTHFSTYLTIATKTTTFSSANVYGGSDTSYHMITLVTNGSNTDIFLDGVYKNSTGEPFTTLSGDQCAIGSRYDGGANQFEGDVDELGMYNFSLNGAQITQLYNSGNAYNPFAPVPSASYDEYFITNLTALYYLNDTSYNETDDIKDTEGGNDGTGFGKTLHNGSGTANLVETNLTGTITGATWDTDNIRGNVLSFDGTDDYVDLATKLDGTEGSISIWTKKQNPVANACVICQNAVSNGIVGIGILYNAGNWNFYVNGTNVAQATALDEWQNIIVTWSNTETKIYSNGVLSDTGVTKTPTINTQNLNLGSFDYTSGHILDYTGNISNIHIYDIALNSTEVLNLYNNERFPLSAENENNFIEGYFTDYNLPLNEGTGTKVYTQPNKWNDRYDFDGTSDYIRISDNSELDLTGEFTISTWINKDSGGGNNFGRIVNKYDNAGADGWDFFVGDGLGVSLVLKLNNVNRLSTGPVLNNNQWYYVTVTQSSAGTSFFVDGVLETTTGTGVSAVANNDDVYIGRWVANNLRNFDGEIDEVRIHNRALTQSEIQDEMNSNAVFDAEDIVAYYDFNGDAEDRNFKSVGHDSTNYLSKGMNFDGIGDYINIDSAQTSVEADDIFTVSTWFKKNDVSGQESLVMANNGASDRFTLDIFNNVVKCGTYDGAWHKSSSTAIVTDTWYNAVCIVNGSSDTITLYLNGVLQSGTSTPSSSGTSGLWIGAYTGGSSYFDGDIQEVRIYDKALSEDEVTTLYNGLKFIPITASEVISGSPISIFSLSGIYGDTNTTNGTAYFNLPYGDVNLTFSKAGWYNNTDIFNVNASTNSHEIEDNYDTVFNITANNVYDNSGINTFNVTLNGTTKNTTTGNISFNLVSTSNYSADFRSSLYFNQTNSSLDASSGTFTFNSYRAILNLIAREKYTQNPISNPTFNSSAQTGNETLFVNNGSIPVTFNKAGYFTADQNFNVPLLTNLSSFFDNVVNATLNITVYDGLNLTTVDTFTATVSYNNISDNTSATGGFATIGITGGLNYTVQVDATGYTIQTQEVVTSGNYTFINITVYPENTVLFNLRDEITRDLINTNMSVEVVGTTGSYTFTTTTGNYTLNNVTPGDYEARYFSTDRGDYKLRSHFFTLDSRSFQQIDLYALNESANITTVTITFQVIDQSLNLVESARVIVSRYYADINTYLDVFARDTNAQGEAIGKFESIDAFYRYRVIYNNETVFQSALGGEQFNVDETKPIFVALGSDINSQYAIIEGIPTTLTYTNTSESTGYFTFTFSSDTSITACLEVTEFGNFSNTVNETCITGTGNNIFFNVNNTGFRKVYSAIGKIDIGQSIGFQNTNTLSVQVGPKNTLLTNAVAKGIAIFFAVLLTILAFTMFHQYPRFALAFEATVLFILAVLPVEIIDVPIMAATTVYVICLVVIYFSGNRNK